MLDENNNQAEIEEQYCIMVMFINELYYRFITSPYKYSFGEFGRVFDKYFECLDWQKMDKNRNELLIKINRQKEIANKLGLKPKETVCQMINYTFDCPGCGKTHEIVIEYGDNAFRCACRYGINLKLLFDNNGEAIVKIE